MRWPASFRFCLLLSAWGASASLTNDSPNLPTVYIYDPQSPSSHLDSSSSVVDPYIAGLIFAERLDVASYHSVGEIADVDLQHLNKYTKTADAPFRKQNSDRQYDRALVLIDNAEPVEDEMLLANMTIFRLSTSPRPQAGSEMLATFAPQVRAVHGSRSSPDGAIFNICQQLEEQVRRSSIWHALGNERSRVDLQYHDVKASINFGRHELVGDIIKVAIKHQVALTLVVNRRPTYGSGPSVNVYGDSFDTAMQVLSRRQEAPLVEPVDMSEPAPTSTSRKQLLATNTATFPLTPECYDTTESCESETNSCSGHGKCVLARKGPASGDDEEPAECYQCKCEPSVVKNNDGSRKTTYYGGSACQKQDISAPFWILTLTAGSLIALVGFGISMLYTMGSAELPSVIGAGVSGPRAK